MANADTYTYTHYKTRSTPTAWSDTIHSTTFPSINFIPIDLHSLHLTAESHVCAIDKIIWNQQSTIYVHSPSITFNCFRFYFHFHFVLLFSDSNWELWTVHRDSFGSMKQINVRSVVVFFIVHFHPIGKIRLQNRNQQQQQQQGKWSTDTTVTQMAWSIY